MRLPLPLILLLLWSQPLSALDYVKFRRDGVDFHVQGRIEATAADGLLLMAPDGQLWQIPTDEIVSRDSDEKPFVPMTAEEIRRNLLREMPAGFSCHVTANYIICHNTSDAYAQWVGGLFERLFRASETFWTNRGFQVRRPETPLVVLVFSDRQTYRRHAVNELGDAVDSIVGYYNLLTNRVTMYDLTGAASPAGGPRARNSVEINRVLSRPEAGGLVATIIHEATHQIAFNSGLQTRMTDVPLWLSEGIAMYFEMPDLNSRRGWRGIGAVNTARVARFRRYAPQRPEDSLRTLLQDDERLRDPDRLLDAYAESWALVYYLIRREPDKFRGYMEMLNEKKPLVWDSPRQRIEEFEKFFGPIDELDGDFVRQTMRIR